MLFISKCGQSPYNLVCKLIKLVINQATIMTNVSERAHAMINIWKVKQAREDREISILVSRCDICSNSIPGAPDDLESQIDMLKEVDENPRLMLCDRCQTEYLIPSWIQSNITNRSK